MNVREKRTETYLKERGFTVHTVAKPSRHGINHDLFKLWDHVAVATRDTEISEGNFIPFETTVWVQTKSRPQYGKDLEKYEGFPSKHKYIFVWEKQKKSSRYKPLNIKEL